MQVKVQVHDQVQVQVHVHVTCVCTYVCACVGAGQVHVHAHVHGARCTVTSMTPIFTSAIHVVAILPPRWFEGFLHVGTEVWYNEDSSTHTVCSWEKEDASCSISLPLNLFKMNDHVTYLGARDMTFCFSFERRAAPSRVSKQHDRLMSDEQFGAEDTPFVVL